MDSADAQLAAYHELCAYTLTHGDPRFIHQHVVDAWAAQQAQADGKPIAIAFALIGLYLHAERGMTGRQVQRVHMLLARQKHAWPVFVLPADRGAVTAIDVLGAAAGPERDEAIDAWVRAVWSAFAVNHGRVEKLLREHGVVAIDR